MTTAEIIAVCRAQAYAPKLSQVQPKLLAQPDTADEKIKHNLSTAEIIAKCREQAYAAHDINKLPDHTVKNIWKLSSLNPANSSISKSAPKIKRDNTLRVMEALDDICECLNHNKPVSKELKANLITSRDFVRLFVEFL